VRTQKEENNNETTNNKDNEHLKKTRTQKDLEKEINIREEEIQIKDQEIKQIRHQRDYYKTKAYQLTNKIETEDL
jgi:hypothetical protein